MGLIREVAVVSGKGGTGKTSLVAQLAQLARPAVAADCDVDAANLALLLRGLDGPHWPFFTGHRASVDLRRCKICGTCSDVCRFDAVARGTRGLPRLDPFVCQGCGACVRRCPGKALHLHENMAGVWAVRPTASGPLVHAMLGVAQDNSGTLVARVREEARTVAAAQGLGLVLIDGPPGIGRPVQAALEGADLVVVVTEPTVSGRHDLGRVLDLAAGAAVPAGLVVNKADLDPASGQAIQALARERGVPVLGEIPFVADVPRALARGDLPFSVPQVVPRVERIWEAVRALLGQIPDLAPASRAVAP